VRLMGTSCLFLSLSKSVGCPVEWSCRLTRFLSLSHPQAVAYHTAAVAFAASSFTRCNAAAVASSVAATADAAGDCVACFDRLAGANQTECAAAETATMLAAHPRICAVRSACIAAGDPPAPAPPTPLPGEIQTCDTAIIKITSVICLEFHRPVDWGVLCVHGAIAPGAKLRYTP